VCTHSLNIALRYIDIINKIVGFLNKLNPVESSICRAV